MTRCRCHDMNYQEKISLLQSTLAVTVVDNDLYMIINFQLNSFFLIFDIL